MDEGNVTVLVDAKEEYTKQLISILKTCIYQGIKSIYMDAKDICNQDNTPENVLMIFQDLLSRIPKWSQDIINKEFERITNVSKCDYIDDLLKVVYISHIKILTIVHSAQKNKKLSLKVPSGSHFIHLCYTECAREFWKDPYLFSDRGSKFEQQKNMRDSENMISNCISETIRKQLPVRHILKEFLNEPDEDIIEEEETDIKETVNKKYLKKLETVVKKELKTTNNISGIDIDLIRQVIREEIEGKQNTNIIKKETVDNVVEKILEKTNAEINEQSTVLEPVIINEKKKKEVKIEDKIEIIPTIESNTSMNSMTSNTSIDSVSNTATSNNTIITIENKEEKINTSLENILNDQDLENADFFKSPAGKEEDADQNLETLESKAAFQKSRTKIQDLENPECKEDDDQDLENFERKEDDDEDEDEDENEDDGDQDGKTIKPKNELFINNIDEINLNLDELDTDICEEINIDDLNNVDLQQSKNEIKKNENTKYIFFNDIK